MQNIATQTFLAKSNWLKPLELIDFYKSSHPHMAPEGLTFTHSNITPRTTRHAKKVDGFDNKIVSFGHQVFVRDVLVKLFNEEFFQKNVDEAVAGLKRRMDTSLGASAPDLKHIRELHALGYLPLSIRVIPEGDVVDEKVPICLFDNTVPGYGWLVGYIETVASNYMWKPCTSATTARMFRMVCDKYAALTGTDAGSVQFQCHDFSYRGMSYTMDACGSGAGHLLSFVGTDTVPALAFIEHFYDADAAKELIGCSVPATEHQIMCSYGPTNELELFRRLITVLYPKGFVSVVADSWDFWKVLTEYLPLLKDEVMAREGRLVIRPDSGNPLEIIAGFDPTEIIVAHDEFSFDALYERYSIGEAFNKKGQYAAVKFGDKYYGHNKVEIPAHVVEGAVATLYKTFGGTVTSKGFKLLDTHIGLIYGDSITINLAVEIFERLAAKGFASGNIVYGIGSYTYAYVTRDQYGFAMKATACVVNDEARAIFKDPKTDSGMKKSAKGYLQVKKVAGTYILRDQVTFAESLESDMTEIFRDGNLLNQTTFAEARERLKLTLPKV